jgi:hypothetical protein
LRYYADVLRGLLAGEADCGKLRPESECRTVKGATLEFPS